MSSGGLCSSPSSSAILVFGLPSAQASTIRDHNATPAWINLTGH